MKKTWIAPVLWMAFSSSALGCPCFNAYHVESIFKDSVNVQCEIYFTHNHIDTIVLSDGKSTVMSTHQGCRLLTDYHSVIVSFVPSSDPHEECNIALDQACNQLKAKRTPHMNISTPPYRGHYN